MVRNAVYVHANGQRVAKIKPDGTIIFYINDPLGSPVILMDEDGNIVKRYRFDPFGNLEAQWGTEPNHYLFTGKERDESGLYYFGARYYNPKIGRWLTCDPIADEHPYAYCNNNPLKYVDASGLQPGMAWGSPYPPYMPPSIPLMLPEKGGKGQNEWRGPIPPPLPVGGLFNTLTYYIDELPATASLAWGVLKTGAGTVVPPGLLDVVEEFIYFELPKYRGRGKSPVPDWMREMTDEEWMYFTEMIYQLMIFGGRLGFKIGLTIGLENLTIWTSILGWGRYVPAIRSVLLPPNFSYETLIHELLHVYDVSDYVIIVTPTKCSGPIKPEDFWISMVEREMQNPYRWWGFLPHSIIYAIYALLSW